MAKRGPSNALTQDNWNEEDAPEELGVFQRASSDQLKMRTIKKARRHPEAPSSGTEKPSLFKNFAFNTNSDTNAPPAFSFLSNESDAPKLTNKTSFPSFNFNSIKESSKKTEEEGLSKKNTESVKPLFSFGNKSATFTSSSQNDKKEEGESALKCLTSTFGSTSNKLPISSIPQMPSFSFTNTSKDENKSSAASFQFGSSTTTTSPSQSNTENKSNLMSFNFGSASAGPTKKDDQIKTSSESFKFGLGSGSKNKVSKSSSDGFKFGTNATQSSNSEEKTSSKSTQPFKFGLSSTSDATAISASEKNTSSEKPKFAFGASSGSDSSKLTFPSFSLQKETTKSLSQFSSLSKSDSKESNSQSPKTNGLTSSDESPPQNKQFLSNLKALNNSVLNWVKQHVEKNSYINLTPIFDDYVEHFKKLEDKYDSSTTESKSSPVKGDTASTSSQSSPFSSATFSFGSAKTSSSSEPFSFGTKKPEGGQSDSSLPKFPSFALPSQPPVKEADNDSNTAEEPPKVEVKEVKEADAVYEKRVKLFLKKDDAYVERGLGTLFLKPAGEAKTQLLVRALTNLGNVLLNIILNSSLPAKRMGKNNVLLVCVPNPPIDGSDKPHTFLLKVKTEADADELLGKIEEHKK